MKKSEYEAKQREHWTTRREGYRPTAEELAARDAEAAEAAGVKWDEEGLGRLVVTPTIIRALTLLKADGAMPLTVDELETVSLWWREGPSLGVLAGEMENWERDALSGSTAVEVPRFSELLKLSLLTRRVRS